MTLCHVVYATIGLSVVGGRPQPKQKKAAQGFNPGRLYCLHLMLFLVFSKDLIPAKACYANQAGSKQEHSARFGKRREDLAPPYDNRHGGRGEKEY